MLKNISLTAICLVLIAVVHGMEPTTAPAVTPEGGNAASVETIVIFRHGEKPAASLGQLTPQGLNRAIALSTVLPEKFGKPDFLFAPDPGGPGGDLDGKFDYIRPLATIEPTAIKLEMPVQTPFGYRHIADLERELTSPTYAKATIFVAWEHHYAEHIAADLMKSIGGDSSMVPTWQGTDYDSLYVLKIQRDPAGHESITFTHEQEGLDGQSKEMPKPAEK